MKKGIITEYNEYCLFCGRPVEAKHHLIGGPNRKKAEEDGLKIPCCNNCHNIGDVLTRIHGNPMAEGYKVEASSCNSKYYKAILVLEEE